MNSLSLCLLVSSMFCSGGGGERNNVLTQANTALLWSEHSSSVPTGSPGLSDEEVCGRSFNFFFIEKISQLLRYMESHRQDALWWGGGDMNSCCAILLLNLAACRGGEAYGGSSCGFLQFLFLAALVTTRVILFYVVDFVCVQDADDSEHICSQYCRINESLSHWAGWMVVKMGGWERKVQGLSLRLLNP